MSKRQTHTPSLIGKFFHSFNSSGSLRWQGRVLAEPSPGYFLVQLYDWFMGYANDQMVIPIAHMVGWKFCDDPEDWRDNGGRLAALANVSSSTNPNERSK